MSPEWTLVYGNNFFKVKMNLIRSIIGSGKILFVLCWIIWNMCQPANSEPVDATCQNWFDKLDLQNLDPRECVRHCSTAQTSLATFDCAIFCDQLCKRKVTQKDLPYDAPDPIPNLCPDEVSLLGDSPKMLPQIQQARKRAIQITKEQFGSSRRLDDESDAFRHFLWTSFLASRTSTGFAKAFTDAHESCTLSNVSQEMDYMNNAKALEWFEHESKIGPVGEKAIVKKALDLLRKGDLVVINPTSHPEGANK